MNRIRSRKRGTNQTVLLVVALLLSATVGCSSADQSSTSPAESPTVRTSTLSDWITAACANDEYFDGAGSLERADSASLCLTVPDRNGNPQLDFGPYSSKSGLDYDASIRPGVPYAVFENDQGITWAFFLYGGTESTPTRLEPLRQFGFKIVPNDG